MRIVLFPGVAIDDNSKTYENFLTKIRLKCDCEASVHIWEKDHEHLFTNLPCKKLRGFVCEVIMDFQQVAIHALDMKVPEADLYIGHSAGSILALAQKKPCIVFGSPANLVELINTKKGKNLKIKDTLNAIMGDDIYPVLNIVNEYDIIAYPLYRGNVTNYKYKAFKYSPFSYFPLTMHSNYWKSAKVMNKIIETIGEWKKKNIV